MICFLRPLRSDKLKVEKHNGDKIHWTKTVSTNEKKR